METIWIYAGIASFLPVCFWIAFWKKQDINEPEPMRLIIKTFCFGLLSVFFAIMFQHMFSTLIPEGLARTTLFSFIEEFLKFLAVFFAALGTIWNNEKRDPMIYMIIGALGFTAVENFYYLLGSLQHSDIATAFIDGGHRVMGASLLHVATSGIIGLCISLVFFKPKKVRMFMTFVGLVLATAIHTLFNVLVTSSNTEYQEIAFYGTWTLIIFLLITFELFNKQEKYRVIKDGVVYHHGKHISYEEVELDELPGEERKFLSQTEYEVYDDDEFRKKFF